MTIISNYLIIGLQRDRNVFVTGENVTNKIIVLDGTQCLFGVVSTRIDHKPGVICMQEVSTDIVIFTTTLVMSTLI